MFAGRGYGSSQKNGFKYLKNTTLRVKSTSIRENLLSLKDKYEFLEVRRLQVDSLPLKRSQQPTDRLFFWQ